MITDRLYQQEAGFYSFKMKDTADLRKSRNLNESESLGLVVDWSNNTINMFNRQESRLERSFYRALHELQPMREDYPRPVSAQESHSLDVHVVGHRQNRLVALRGADHR